MVKVWKNSREHMEVSEREAARLRWSFYALVGQLWRAKVTAEHALVHPMLTAEARKTAEEITALMYRLQEQMKVREDTLHKTAAPSKTQEL